MWSYWIQGLVPALQIVCDDGEHQGELRYRLCSTQLLLMTTNLCRCATQMPYACKLLFQELQAMNVVPRLKLRDY
jgi:DNA-directed RNA polymerase beta subunit